MAVDLSTTYLGLRLQNPLVVAASPITNELHVLQRLEQAGASAAVLASLFEEQIEHEALTLFPAHGDGAESAAENLNYFPALEDYNTGPDGYLRHVEAAKRAVSIPIIGSVNGVTHGGWARFATLIQDAGADALELNIYDLATDPLQTAADVEQRCLDVVRAVRDKIKIPLAIKLSPFYSSLPNLARELLTAGANGLVLFNRFCQPDIDLDTLELVPRLVLSHRSEMRLPLRWIGILRGQFTGSLAATTGIQNAEDVVKVLLAGADVAMMASVLLRHGPEHLEIMLNELRAWFEAKGYPSVEQIKGSVSQRRCSDPAARERANYMRTVSSRGNIGH